MSNYRALGIDKEMSKLFQEYKKEDLNLLEASEYFTCPYIQRRKENQFYGSKYIRECKGIRLTNTKEIIFRGFDPKDIFIC